MRAVRTGATNAGRNSAAMNSAVAASGSRVSPKDEHRERDDPT